MPNKVEKQDGIGITCRRRYFRGARASRVLVAASRRDGLRCAFPCYKRDSKPGAAGKFALAGTPAPARGTHARPGVSRHGIITLVGSVQLGGPVFLCKADIDRIAGRRDEHHRQRALGL